MVPLGPRIVLVMNAPTCGFCILSGKNTLIIPSSLSMIAPNPMDGAEGTDAADEGKDDDACGRAVLLLCSCISAVAAFTAAAMFCSGFFLSRKDFHSHQKR